MFVFSNLAISLDGKIATANREFFPLGTPEDLRMMQFLRKRSDAILMGASTLRTFRRPLVVSGARRQPLNVIMSSRLEGLSPEWKFFIDPRIQRLIFTTGKASPRRIAQLSRSSEVVVLSKCEPSAILKELRRRGIERLLVEGGGGVMWDFARGNLIDEYYVTLTPRILGGTEAPTLVDGAGFTPKNSLKLKLKRCRRVGQELYLIYSKTGKRGP